MLLYDEIKSNEGFRIIKIGLLFKLYFWFKYSNK